MTTLKGRLVADRVAERREQYFSNIDVLPKEQIDEISARWHRLAARYQNLLSRAMTKH